MMHHVYILLNEAKTRTYTGFNLFRFAKQRLVHRKTSRADQQQHDTVHQIPERQFTAPLPALFGHSRSNLLHKFFCLVPHLGQASVFVGGGAITQRASHHRRITTAVQIQHTVIFGRAEAFHRTGVHAQHGGAGHQITERNVGLPGCPFVGGFAAWTVDDVAEHHVAVKIQRLGGDFSHTAGELDQFVHVSIGHLVRAGEHDKMRGVHDLLLVPRMRQQFGALDGVVDDEKTIRLQTVWGGR